jgi:DNA-binding response OmpR family regulator
MNDYIAKPFNPVQLFNKIAEHLHLATQVNGRPYHVYY